MNSAFSLQGNFILFLEFDFLKENNSVKRNKFHYCGFIDVYLYGILIFRGILFLEGEVYLGDATHKFQYSTKCNITNVLI